MVFIGSLDHSKELPIYYCSQGCNWKARAPTHKNGKDNKKMERKKEEKEREEEEGEGRREKGMENERKEKRKKLDNCVLRTRPRRGCMASQVA